MGNNPTPRADQLRAMREAKYLRNIEDRRAMAKAEARDADAKLKFLKGGSAEAKEYLDKKIGDLEAAVEVASQKRGKPRGAKKGRRK